MPANVQKNAAAVALGRKGGKKGGPARAAKLTPEQCSESARKAVQARWSKAAPAAAVLDTSKKALHLCLKGIKDAKNENELRRLTEELQRIVFHKDPSP
jgi:thiamine pyrophosphate-dependent acetolactate synthase large subunit-like protein